MDEAEVRLPIGSGPEVMLAQGLRNGAGDHALLVRAGDASRALLTADHPRSPGERQRLIVTPLDDAVELRIDGDALAVWLAAGSVGRAASSTTVPAWANLAGLLLLLVMVGFAVLGAASFFSWLLRLVAST